MDHILLKLFNYLFVIGQIFVVYKRAFCTRGILAFSLQVVLGVSYPFTSYSSEICSVSGDELYKIFREYRLSIPDRSNDLEYLSKYFSVEKTNELKRIIDLSNTEIDRNTTRNAYNYHMKFGKGIKIVYGYTTECQESGTATLIMDAYFHPSPIKLRNKIGSKVSIEFREEVGNWRIYSFVVDNRKDSVADISDDTVIDVYDSNGK